MSAQTKSAIQKETNADGASRRSKGNKKKSRRGNVDVSKNVEVKFESNGKAGTEGRKTATKNPLTLGAEPNAWKTEENTAKVLFGDVEPTPQPEMTEEEEVHRAIVESMKEVTRERHEAEMNFYEEVDDGAHDRSDEEDTWGKVKRNLPDPEPDKDDKISDANNNSGSHQIPKNSSKTISTPEFDKSLIDDPSLKNVTIDIYGRVNGRTECHMFMGKGARRREQEFIEQQRLRAQRVNNSQTDSKITSPQFSTPQTLTNEPHPEIPSKTVEQPSKQLSKLSETTSLPTQNREQNSKQLTNETSTKIIPTQSHSVRFVDESVKPLEKIPESLRVDVVRSEEQLKNLSRAAANYFEPDEKISNRQDVKSAEFSTFSSSHDDSNRPSRPILSSTNSNYSHNNNQSQRYHSTSGKSVNKGFYVDERNHNKSAIGQIGPKFDSNSRNTRENSYQDSSRDYSNVGRNSNKNYDERNRSYNQRGRPDQDPYKWQAEKNRSQSQNSQFQYGQNYRTNNEPQIRDSYKKFREQQNFYEKSNERFSKNVQNHGDDGKFSNKNVKSHRDDGKLSRNVENREYDEKIPKEIENHYVDEKIPTHNVKNPYDGSKIPKNHNDHPEVPKNHNDYPEFPKNHTDDSKFPKNPANEKFPIVNNENSSEYSNQKNSSEFSNLESKIHHLSIVETPPPTFLSDSSSQDHQPPKNKKLVSNESQKSPFTSTNEKASDKPEESHKNESKPQADKIPDISEFNSRYTTISTSREDLAETLNRPPSSSGQKDPTRSIPDAKKIPTSTSPSPFTIPPGFSPSVPPPSLPQSSPPSTCPNCDLVAPLEVRHARLRLHDPLLYKLLCEKRDEQFPKPSNDEPNPQNFITIPANVQTLENNENWVYESKFTDNSMETMEYRVDEQFTDESTAYSMSETAESSIPEHNLYYQQSVTDDNFNDDYPSSNDGYFGNSTLPRCNVAAMNDIYDHPANYFNRGGQHNMTPDQYQQFLEYQKMLYNSSMMVHPNVSHRRDDQRGAYVGTHDCYHEEQMHAERIQVIPHAAAMAVPFMPNDYHAFVQGKPQATDWNRENARRSMSSSGFGGFDGFPAGHGRGRAQRSQNH